MRRLAVGLASTAFAAAMAAACGGDNTPPPLRQMSNTYSYIIIPTTCRRTRARTSTTPFRSSTARRASRSRHGEGQLFASNGEGAKTWDGLAYGPEIGTYHAKLNFVVAGTWAAAIRFRRDSLRPLERTDWMQEVLNEKPSATP